MKVEGQPASRSALGFGRFPAGRAASGAVLAGKQLEPSTDAGPASIYAHDGAGAGGACKSFCPVWTGAERWRGRVDRHDADRPLAALSDSPICRPEHRARFPLYRWWRADSLCPDRR